MSEIDRHELIRTTSELVSAYLATHRVDPESIVDIIQSVFRTLQSVGVVAQVPEPAVPIRRSITPEYLICLEDGKKLKMMKRHIQTRYGLTPDEYRERWGLARDYPMVSPNYSKTRARLAKKIGLGRKRDQ